MTRPDLDALAALLDKAQAMGDANTRMGTHWDGCETVHQLCMIDRLCAALTALLAYVRELERDREAAALAMRERCAQACDRLGTFDGRRLAAKIRALEA